MKNTILRPLLSTLVATVLISSPRAYAASVTLEGSGSYKFTSSDYYYEYGTRQSGRYRNLGTDYYRKTTIGMDWIVNNSSYRTGPLSLEFWGMPYYGADTGIVLMTRSAGRLPADTHYRNSRWRGRSIFLDEYRFPEINIWEKTRKGWRFRDALSFRRDNLL